jgi:hypothetical protein
MAEILPFRSRAPRAGASETRLETTGQILLFTGIRYERHDDGRPSPVEPKLNRGGQPRRSRRRA